MKGLNRPFVACAFVIFFFAGNAFAAPKPYEKPDRSYITITGDVASPTITKGAGFTLDYGEGLIEVEVDDLDFDDDSQGVLAGERVTVYGRIDADLFETRSIEAGSVHVHNRNMYYFANSADEEWERYAYSPPLSYPVDGTWLTVSGIVQSVDVDGKEFEIDTGLRELQVNTQKLGYNPLDRLGIQRIRKGDQVSVTGRLDKNFFDEDDIIATSVVTLFKKVRQPS